MDASIFEILSERFVKPSTPTPPSLRSYKLSRNDQIQPRESLPLVFFYTNWGSETSQILEIALSKTLSCHYPFAGRLMDNLFIECNDMGVLFTEARIKYKMNEFLKQQNSQIKDLVFPKHLSSPNAGDSSLLLVQLSYFNCIGIALSICMSHKLGDVCTFSAFINDWAAMVRHFPNHILSPSPQLNIGVSLFPRVDDPSLIKEYTISRTKNPPTKLLFQAHKIAELKEILATSSGVEKPTRVEVVSALLYRCAMVSSKATSGSFKAALLALPMNLRSVIVPPLPKNSVGNLVESVTIATTKEDEMTLSLLVSQLRDAKIKLQKEYKEKERATGTPTEVANAQTDDDDDDETVSNNNLDIYLFSSWCRYPFYDVDFGWGKPTLLSLPLGNGGSKNIFVLMDSKDGDAIQVIALLEEPQMSAFLNNEELLAFASISNA